MAEKVEVSIIIPTRNRRVELKKCLGSILFQDFKDVEIIVIDNASVDGTTRMLKEDYPLVKIIQNEKNEGAARARNQGIIVSKGKFLLFLDSDVELLTKNTISAMIRIMETDKIIGALGGETEDKRIIKVRGYGITKRNGYSYPIELNCKQNKMIECDYLSTSNCFVRKHTVEKIGGFDPYYMWTGEDKELGFKIKRLGYKIIAHPNTLVWHSGLTKTKLAREHAIAQTHKTRVRFVLKNYNLRTITLFVIIELRDLIAELIKRRWRIALYRVAAYCWNFLVLGRTLYVRIKNPNFLEEKSKVEVGGGQR